MHYAANQGLHLVRYDSDMATQTETMTERFNRLTKGMSDAEIAFVMGITVPGIRKIKAGDTQTMKLDNALRLCRRLSVSPWYLAGEPEPTQPASAGGETEAIGHAAGALEAAVRELTAEVRAQRGRLEQLESVAAKKSGPRRKAS